MHDDLFQFFGAYFHQDWDYEGSPDEILSSFIQQHHAPKELADLADRIDAYVEARTDDALAAALSTELGCSYVPSADGMTARDWLRHVAARLRG